MSGDYFSMDASGCTFVHVSSSFLILSDTDRDGETDSYNQRKSMKLWKAKKGVMWALKSTEKWNQLLLICSPFRKNVQYSLSLVFPESHNFKSPHIFSLTSLSAGVSIFATQSPPEPHKYMRFDFKPSLLNTALLSSFSVAWSMISDSRRDGCKVLLRLWKGSTMCLL